MNVQHHNKRGYYNTSDGTTVHATITLTRNEWDAFCVQVKRAHKQATERYDTYIRDSLSSFDATPPIRVRTIGTTASRVLLGVQARDINYGVIVR